MEEILDRVLNVHSIKAIGSVLAGYGVISSDQVEAIINSGGGNTTMLVAGLIAYAFANFWRKH